ncbi:CehA/McbA family metallohydrolase [Terrimonas pollutisoli]|uniref:CehA/McbA family metallohydrolase n=1 Tax=Terrimonas pollutisoli TaxID=3034147 RepID=UPI0023ED86BA|nr:CehA/McbA family metallohydrolase [Terrimonas sp. H1YJ31]
MKKLFFFFLPVLFLLPVTIYAQELSNTLPLISDVESQPLLAQALRLDEALSFLGSSISAEDTKRLKALRNKAPGKQITKLVQEILDPYCLAMVEINPEARVKVIRGPAQAKLIQWGWTSFLVKVHNEAGVTAKLEVESPNAAPLFHVSTFGPRAKSENALTPGQVANRFAEMVLYRNRPLLPALSGLNLEYVVLQIYSRDAGSRELEIGFNVGQGSQDIGFRNTIPILFSISKAVKVNFRVKDEDGSPVMASFIISDGIEHILEDSIKFEHFFDTTSWGFKPTYRYYWAMVENAMPWSMEKNRKVPGRLKGIYPLPSRRVAAHDEYPDFFFQPQVYRSDGEYIHLPPGRYTVTFTRGPEYIPQSKQLVVPQDADSFEVSFQLKRWINMAKHGWYSADHHVHAAGCSHYESPSEGVNPADMWRQVLGEDLKVAAVLAWGPGWYHQKEFFTGEVNRLSTEKNLMRYDVEVSGFPSHHAGHLVLLRLREDDYPGTKDIEDWPSWTLPVLNWAKGQGGITGYAHSGWGLEPVEPTRDLPNYIQPKMDGIGANEYIVTIAHQAVDFYSLGDTPAPWELNMWYHSLNCGFRTRLSGETDFPCIFDERVGVARSYFKPDGKLDFDGYVNAIKTGRSYVSDGFSHIIDFSVNGVEPGVSNSELNFAVPQNADIKARVAAYLLPEQDERGADIAKMKLTEPPYWHLERARLGTSRKVPVELIVNGVPVDTIEITADGHLQDISFNYTIKKSSWIALRIFPSVHTNPVFVIVNKKPIGLKKSAQWCRQAVDKCWEQKEKNIRQTEKAAAEAAYNKAREVYEKIIHEASDN